MLRAALLASVVCIPLDALVMRGTHLIRALLQIGVKNRARLPSTDVLA